MVDYIDRETALAKLIQDGRNAKNVHTIMGIPAADVEPVRHGRWLVKKHTFELPGGSGWCTGTYPSCSLCGAFETGFCKPTTYCPNCGAKMDKEDGNGDVEDMGV